MVKKKNLFIKNLFIMVKKTIFLTLAGIKLKII